MADLGFERDLYRGTAQDYDRSRVPYPRALTEDLARWTGADGTGRLLDLACGPGVLSFALHAHFAEVWAVDQEPDMIAVVQAKAQAAGIGTIRALTSSAEELDLPPESYDLIALGNAFHRLPRQAVAASVFRWLKPGGYLALVWGGDPWGAETPWQLVQEAAKDRWLDRTGTRSRIPAEYAEARKQRPDEVILRESGFEHIGAHEFRVDHEWTAEALIGFMFSTSVLSRAALGDLAPEFEADVRRELLACEPTGRFRQTLSFACRLSRRPVV